MWNDRKAFDYLGQDVGAMVEARNAREWEEQSREPKIDICGVNSELGYAWDALEKGYNRLSEACGLAEGAPMEYRIQSVLNRLEDLQNEIRALQKEVKIA